MLKKVVSTTLPAVLGLGLANVSSASNDFQKAETDASQIVEVTSSQNANLSKEEIDNKLQEIADKYDIGEKMSLEDQRFVQSYAMKANNGTNDEISVRSIQDDTWKVSGVDSNSALGGTLSGTVKVSLNMWSNNISCNLTTNVTKGAPNSHKTTVRIVAYGFIGGGGTYAGKVADETIGNSSFVSSTAKSWPTTDSKGFGANVLYYDCTVKSEIQDANGSYLGIQGSATLQ